MLLNNGFLLYQSGLVEGSAHALLPGQWDAPRQWEKFLANDGETAIRRGTANPPGSFLPLTWHGPITDGEIVLRTDGEGSLAADLIPTRPMTIDLTGAGDLEATAGLVVSMLLALTGGGDLTATIEGRLNASIDMTGSGDLAGSMTGFANLVVDLLGQGDLDATIAAFGDMSIDIVVTGTGLTTANVGAAVWSALAAANNDAGTMGEKLNDAGSASNPWTEVLETGFTAGELLLITAAAVAGKLDRVDNGDGTFTITIRGLADTKDRIVGIVDENGNRVSATYDGT
jgi:hypothetical protein